MAKTYLTNINLKGNQLLNAAIQPSASAPSALTEGQLYYNTNDGIFYFSTGSGTSNWEPVGVQYVKSVGTNLAVDGDGVLSISSDPVFTTVTANSDGAGTNFKVGNDAWIGDINVSNTMNVRGVEDATVGYISFGSNGDSNKIGTNVDGDLLISANNNNVVLSADGDIYKGSVSANNRIATFADLSAGSVQSVSGTANQITVTMNGEAATISLPNNVDIADRLIIGGSFGEDSGTLEVKNYNDISMFTVDTAASPMDQYHGYNTYTDATGIVNLNGFLNISSEGNVPSGYLFMNVYGASTNPTLHLESKGDLALRAGADGNDGNIILYTGQTSSGQPGKAYIGWNHDNGGNYNNQIATLGDISDAAYITSVDTTNFNVSNHELYLNSEIEVQKTSYWRDGTQQGVIAAQSDSSLRLTAITGQLQLESNGGDVRINPSSTVTWFNNNIYINADSGIIGTDNNSLHLNADNGVITTDAQEFHTTKVELWNGGDTTGSRLGLILAHPSDGSLSVVASNQMVLEAHSGDITLVPSTGSAYIGSISDSNKIATMSDIHASAQGLSVLEPVIAAAGTNIDITVAVSTLIGGVELGNGNRVLLNAQATATENGIYIFNGSTNMLERSTNAEDAALKEGSYTLVTEGTYAAQGYIVTSTPYTNATIWTQFSAAGEYTAGSGITISGQSISVNRSAVDSWYDASGSASTAETNAKNYADGLAVNYDPSGAASTAQTNAQNYADGLVTSLHLTSKYVGTITGNGSTDSFDIIHNLGTRAVSVQVYQSSGSPDTQWADVEVDVIRTTEAKITVGFGAAPSTGTTYEVVIVG